MKNTKYVLVLTAILFTASIGPYTFADDETAAKAGEQVGVEGQFVRLAENSEGYVIVGYRTANESVNGEWMLLDVGMTLQEGVKTQIITRDHIKVVAPDGTIISMATQEEYEKAKGSIIVLEQRSTMDTDSINYFPASANIPCRMEFFVDPTHPREGLAYDQFDLSSSNACAGLLFFHIPGGIQYGNYNLDVHFAESIVKVPMKIMTKDEAKAFEEQWKAQLKANRHKGK
ncbi:MAG: hypothetical protein WBP36_16455 [Thermoanaerobaculia bacterium]